MLLSPWPLAFPYRFGRTSTSAPPPATVTASCRRQSLQIPTLWRSCLMVSLVSVPLRSLSVLFQASTSPAERALACDKDKSPGGTTSKTDFRSSWNNAGTDLIATDDAGTVVAAYNPGDIAWVCECCPLVQVRRALALGGTGTDAVSLHSPTQQ